jgi:hypothetical protein
MTVYYSTPCFHAVSTAAHLSLRFMDKAALLDAYCCDIFLENEVEYVASNTMRILRHQSQMDDHEEIRPTMVGPQSLVYTNHLHEGTSRPRTQTT